MHLRWGDRRRRVPRLLAPGPGDGPDLISTLPDDLLLLILARLECAAAAARTGVLSRRWRGLWPRLRRIVFNNVALPSLEAALGRFPPPPPTVSLLQIRLPKEHQANAARFSSLLHAAARLDPEELFLSRFVGGSVTSVLLKLPSFHRTTSIVLEHCSIICVPAGVEFPALETLSLSFCTADPESFISRCPRLRTLRLDYVWFLKGALRVNSLSLQELVVDLQNTTLIADVNIVAPVLTQLTVSLNFHQQGGVSVLAPMGEKVSWHCYFAVPTTMFGLWIVWQLNLQMAEGEGKRSSLHLHASPWSTIWQGGEEDNFAQEIEKHMIISFSVLELHLTTDGHGYGAFVVHLLGMNRIRRDMQRLKVSLRKRSMFPKGCPPHCPCDFPNWNSQTISLTSLEEVEINGFEAEDHEFDFLKLILRCAPMLKQIIMKLSQEASECSEKCTKIYDIFKEYPTVEYYVYLSSDKLLKLKEAQLYRETKIKEAQLDRELKILSTNTTHMTVAQQAFFTTRWSAS